MVGGLALLMTAGASVGAGGGQAFASHASQYVGPSDAPPAKLIGNPKALADPNRLVDVFVALNGAPLAETYIAARAANSKAPDIGVQLRRSADMKTEQTPVATAAMSMGAAHTQTVSNVANGVVVNAIAAKNVAKLQALPNVQSVEILGAIKPNLQHSVPLIGAQAVLDGPLHLTGHGTTVADLDTGIDYTHRDFGGSGNPADYQYAVAHANDPDLSQLNYPATDNANYAGKPMFPNQKVIGGFDFVGNQYDVGNTATDQLTTTVNPVPNPIDQTDHGTWTASTIAGFGVPNGSILGSDPGVYVHTTDSFTVYHGVAPGAQLYAYKVCGNHAQCPDAAIIPAIDRAMDPRQTGNMNDHVDALNESLGSDFGVDPVQEGELNMAEQVGVAIAVSAGNAGSVPFVLGSPSNAERVLSVAASVSGTTALLTNPATRFPIPFFTATFGPSVSTPVTGPLLDTHSLGCNPNPFPAGSLSGYVVLIDRGKCAFSQKAFNAQAAGAIGVIVVSQAGTPAGGAACGSSPSICASITIPLIVISNQDGAQLRSLLSQAPVTVTIGLNNNVTGLNDTLAFFTSGGPSLSGVLKPDISAPGSNIQMAAFGTGTGASIASGTSFAAPHVTGSLALLKQEHPDWTSTELEAVLVNTSVENVSSTNTSFSTPSGPAALTLSGAGRVDVLAASKATTVVLGGLLARLSFGFQALTAPATLSQPFTIENKSTVSQTYSLSALSSFGTGVLQFQVTRCVGNVAIQRAMQTYLNAAARAEGNGDQAGRQTALNGFKTVLLQATRAGYLTGACARGLNAVVGSFSSEFLSFSQNGVTVRTITVPAGGSAVVTASFTLNPALFQAFGLSGSGLTAPGNALAASLLTGQVMVNDLTDGMQYHIPFAVVARQASAITGSSSPGLPSVQLINGNAFTGRVDLFSLLSSGPQMTGGPNDLQYLGARISGANLQLAVTTYGAIPNPATQTFYFFIFLPGQSSPRYLVENFDVGLANGSPYPSGQNATYVLDLATGIFVGQTAAGVPPVSPLVDSPAFSNFLVDTVPLADIPNFDSSGTAIPLTGNIGIVAESFDFLGNPFETLPPSGNPVNFNVTTQKYTPQSLTTTVPPNTTVSVPVTTNPSVNDDEIGLLGIFRDNPPNQQIQAFGQ